MEAAKSLGRSNEVGLASADRHAVLDQLARILASPEFKAPGRIRGFLTYVVEEALAGRADRIKAYSIAVSVFGREQNFDIHNDPVVRIEAGRLRRALERYYLTAGTLDEILIEIPKGGYAPWFEHRGASSPPAPADKGKAAGPALDLWERLIGAWRQSLLIASGVVAALGFISAAAVGLAKFQPQSVPPDQDFRPGGPAVLVRPFATLTQGEESTLFAAGITEELISQLARFKELRVFGRETSRAMLTDEPARQITQQLGAEFLVEGSVRVSGRQLRVNSRLLNGATGQVLWAQSYDTEVGSPGAIDIEAAVAARVATAVGQPYSVIFQPVRRHPHSLTPDSFDAHRCVLQFYHYRAVLNRAEHESTRDCMEGTTQRYPNFSTGWAMLAYLYLDEARFDLNRRQRGADAMTRAREAAELAVRLDPDNVRALQAQMTVLFFGREPTAALELGERALALNPNDTELLAEVGSRVAQAGDWKRGQEMLERALLGNPGHSGLYVGLLAQAAYMQGNDARALELIRRADLKQFSIFHFVAALIYARADLLSDAKASRMEFLRMRPRFFESFETELAMRNFNARDRAILTEGALQAGFPIRASMAQ